MTSTKRQQCEGSGAMTLSGLCMSISKFGLMLCLLFVSFFTVEASVLEDLEIVSERVRDEAFGGRRPVDVQEIREHIVRQQKDGSWTDIDYDDRSRTHWIPREHLSRILNLARAYRTPDGELEGVPDVRDAFLLALRYWTVRDPQSDNWFRQSIGSPGSLGDAAILMVGEIPPDLLEATGKLVQRSGFTRTGANLVWEARNLLTWACVTKDPDLLREVVQHIGGEIRVTTEEGIQPDDSFHQHGPQNYLLGYGRSYASNVTNIALLLSGTVFAFPEEKFAFCLAWFSMVSSGSCMAGRSIIMPWGVKLFGVGQGVIPGMREDSEGSVRICDRQTPHERRNTMLGWHVFLEKNLRVNLGLLGTNSFGDLIPWYIVQASGMHRFGFIPHGRMPVRCA